MATILEPNVARDLAPDSSLQSSLARAGGAAAPGNEYADHGRNSLPMRYANGLDHAVARQGFAVACAPSRFAELLDCTAALVNGTRDNEASILKTYHLIEEAHVDLC
jgi:hypothetical protein